MPTPHLPDRKNFNSKDPNPCSGCSNCCEYISTQIDSPTTLKDFDQILWYLLHQDIWVYIEENNDWYLQFNTPCRKLEAGRCSYYKNRPRICRVYQPQDCVRYGEGEPHKHLFQDEKEFFRYLAGQRPRMFEKLAAACEMSGEEIRQYQKQGRAIA